MTTYEIAIAQSMLESRAYSFWTRGEADCQSLTVRWLNGGEDTFTTLQDVAEWMAALNKEPQIGTPEFAAYWEAKYGRENLDPITLRNLDAMKGGAK